jgi:hypothetical protein
MRIELPRRRCQPGEQRIASGMPAGARAITRSLESACAIAGSNPAVADVLQWLHAYTTHASARFCCRVERPIPAHRRAFDNAFSCLRPQPCRVCPSASWPHSAGWTTSGPYYADDRGTSFRLRRTGALRPVSNRGGARSSASISAIGVCSGLAKVDKGAAAAWVTWPTIACHLFEIETTWWLASPLMNPLIFR